MCTFTYTHADSLWKDCATFSPPNTVDNNEFQSEEEGGRGYELIERREAISMTSVIYHTADFIKWVTSVNTEEGEMGRREAALSNKGRTRCEDTSSSSFEKDAP